MISRLNAILVALTLGAAAAQAGGAETIRVVVNNMAFDPPRVTAHVGDTIEWVNSDALAHTTTGGRNEWDVVLPANGHGRVILRAIAEIDYHCRFHPSMTAHVSVTE